MTGIRPVLGLGMGFWAHGMVFGSFGEASESVHSLVDALATSRVRVAGPQRGRKGVFKSEEGEK